MANKAPSTPVLIVFELPFNTTLEPLPSAIAPRPLIFILPLTVILVISVRLAPAPAFA